MLFECDKVNLQINPFCDYSCREEPNFETLSHLNTDFPVSTQTDLSLSFVWKSECHSKELLQGDVRKCSPSCWRKSIPNHPDCGVEQAVRSAQDWLLITGATKSCNWNQRIIYFHIPIRKREEDSSATCLMQETVYSSFSIFKHKTLHEWFINTV